MATETSAAHTSTTVGTLADAGQILLQTGPFGSQLHSGDYVADGVPVVPTEAIGRRRLITDRVPRISGQTAARLARHRLRRGDILFARRGAQATGFSALVEKGQEGWICGTGAILLRVQSPDIDPAFLSFLLAWDRSIAWLKSHAVGAVMPNLNTEVIRGLPLRLPPFNVQRAVASVLESLDDKIELNRKMNETLGAFARAIFKSWFVDFDPVRAKAEGRKPRGTPANVLELFPRALNRGIPAGWKSGTFGEITDNARLQVAPGDASGETPYIGLEHMPRKSVALSEWGRADEVASNKFAFAVGDILFGKLRPYFHKVGLAAVDGVCSTDILVLKPKQPDWLGFVLGHASSEEMVNYANAGSTGTKMPRTNWSDLAGYEVVVPTVQVARAYNDIVGPMLGRIRCNIHESRTLVSLRDALLPELLSGRLRLVNTGTVEVACP